jgi:GT2 family glycosyltransferase
MEKEPLVFIITINWNGYEDTLECIRSLSKLTYKNYKIVVVDNGSKKKEGLKLKRNFPEISMIQNYKNVGFSKANNQGIKLALNKNAKYILLLNNDTVVNPDFLSILISYAEKNTFQGILSPKILVYKSQTIWAVGGRLNKYTSIPTMIGQGDSSSNFKKVIEPDYAPGCAMLINKLIIKKLGLLDEKYFAYYEDTDYSYRAKKMGFGIKIIPNSIVWHKVSKSTKNKSVIRIGETQSYLLARNGILFGYSIFGGFYKKIYLSCQYLIKYPLYLLLKVDSIESAVAYTKGLIDGTLYLLNKSKMPILSAKYIKQS